MGVVLTDEQRIRFIKDFDLPMSKHTCGGLYSYYRYLYDSFFPFEEEMKLAKYCEAAGGFQNYNEKCKQVADRIIDHISNSESYVKFNQQRDIVIDGLSYNDSLKNVPNGDVYVKQNNGKRFLSVDLKSANFQALGKNGANVLQYDSYSDMVLDLGGDDYMTEAKHMRQVIFGKLNPKRIVTVEKLIMNTIYTVLCDLVDKDTFILYKMNSDELIWEISQDGELWRSFVEIGWYRDFISNIEKTVKEKLGFDVKAEFFDVIAFDVVNRSGSSIDAFLKKNLVTGTGKLKKVSTIFYPQVYKIVNRMEITKNDLYFYFENNLACFNDPLELKVEESYVDCYSE